jgi:hypothetical protein
MRLASTTTISQSNNSTVNDAAMERLLEKNLLDSTRLTYPKATLADIKPFHAEFSKLTKEYLNAIKNIPGVSENRIENATDEIENRLRAVEDAFKGRYEAISLRLKAYLDKQYPPKPGEKRGLPLLGTPGNFVPPEYQKILREQNAEANKPLQKK